MSSPEHKRSSSQVGLALEVVVKDAAWQKALTDEIFIAGIARAVADVVEFEAPEYAVIAFADNAEVQNLNARFLGKNKPTNVLSFPAHKPQLANLPEPDDSGDDQSSDFLGDIILARETVVEEAADQNIPLDHHVCHLIIHGVLHLLGYDHDQHDAAEDMEALETEILAKLDVPNPYTEELVDAG